MSSFEEERKKKLFNRWNKLSKDMSKIIFDIDHENARPILEEIGYTLLSYPNMDMFLLEYEKYLFDKQSSKKKSSDKEESENNVINIFDFRDKKDKE